MKSRKPCKGMFFRVQTGSSVKPSKGILSFKINLVPDEKLSCTTLNCPVCKLRMDIVSTEIGYNNTPGTRLALIDHMMEADVDAEPGQLYRLDLTRMEIGMPYVENLTPDMSIKDYYAFFTEVDEEELLEIEKDVYEFQNEPSGIF